MALCERRWQTGRAQPGHTQGRDLRSGLGNYLFILTNIKQENRRTFGVGPLYSVIAGLRETSPPDARYVFATQKGKPMNVDNLRHRVWYPTLEIAGLRKRTMYQTRHTFASLMLSHGEDPMWVARMLGHTSLQMIFRHYGKFVRNRSRKDGARFLRGLEEAGVVTALGTQNTVAIPANPLPVHPREKVKREGERKAEKDRHTLGTLCKFVAKKGATVARNPLN
jgi:hypothetical protein